MERCANSEATNAYMSKLEEQERELEFLEDDIEYKKKQIEDLINSMYETADYYKNIDGREEIKNFVMDLL